MKKSNTRLFLFIVALLVIIIFVGYYYYNNLGDQYESMEGCITVNVKVDSKYVSQCIPIAQFKNALQYANKNKPIYFLNYLVTYSSNEGPLDFQKIGEKYNISISASNPIDNKPAIKNGIKKDLKKPTKFFDYLLNNGALRFQTLADDFNITSNEITYKRRIDSFKAPDSPKTGKKWDVDKEEWVERTNVNSEWTPVWE